MYKIIALIGKAGSGKDTILNRICKEMPALHKIIGTTTRPKRDYEQDGVDYHFVDKELFATKILTCELLEAMEFNDWFYGTDIRDLSEDQINIGVFSPGAAEIISEDSRTLVYQILIDAEDYIRMRRQFNREGVPNTKEIIRRYKTDEEDFYDILEPFATLINNTPEDLPKILEKLKKLIDGLDKNL